MAITGQQNRKYKSDQILSNAHQYSMHAAFVEMTLHTSVATKEA